MVSAKKSKIFSRLFFRKIVLKIMLSYGLERKEAFYDDKCKLCKVRKKWVFSKGKVFSVKKSKIFCLFLKNRLRNNVKLWSKEKQSLSEQ